MSPALEFKSQQSLDKQIKFSVDSISIPTSSAESRATEQEKILAEQQRIIEELEKRCTTLLLEMNNKRKAEKGDKRARAALESQLQSERRAFALQSIAFDRLERHMIITLLPSLRNVDILYSSTADILNTILTTPKCIEEVWNLRGHDLQFFVDLFDKAVSLIDSRYDLHAKCLAELRDLSSASLLLPSSCVSPFSEVEKGVPRGSGAFADLWRGSYNNSKVAIKIIRKYRARDMNKLKKKFCKEVVLWKQLQHPNIVPIVGASLQVNTMRTMSIWMENGNLVMYLRENPMANRLQLLIDTANGLKYLHEGNIVHGNLKGVNILVDQNHRACVADFGLAVVCYDTMPVVATSSHPNTMSIRWMAPELILSEEPYSRRLSVQSDMYAFGMVIYEVFSGRVPFHELSRDGPIVTAIIQGTRPSRPLLNHLKALSTSYLSDELWSTMRACWSTDRSKRPDMDVILDRLTNAMEQSQTDATDNFVKEEDEIDDITANTST